MPNHSMTNKEVLKHNRISWDAQSLNQSEWSRPVNHDEILAAKNGNWQVQLTHGKLNPEWLGDIKDKNILCLASAGGQQAPILAAAGAAVTVFDLSNEQLKQDQMVAEREELTLRTIQGDMRNLSVFDDACFDIVFLPIANLYVPDIRSVWHECHRVLKQGGKLLAGFYNPVVFVAERNPDDIKAGIIHPRFKLPYSDTDQLSSVELENKIKNGEPLVFGHSLTDQIAGQLEAGFLLQGFQEDKQPVARFVIDGFVPTLISTCAVKI